MSTSSPVRLLPDYMRAADMSGDLTAFLDAAWTAGVGSAVEFLTAADPDDGVGDTAHPVDPEFCPAAWLPWLARLMGADIEGLNDEQARWYLSRNGRAPVGSDLGITTAAQATLTGTRAVSLSKPSTWELTITVDGSEVTDVSLTLAVAERSVPAGVEVTVTPSSLVTLEDLRLAYSTLADITATGKNLDQLRFG